MVYWAIPIPPEFSDENDDNDDEPDQLGAALFAEFEQNFSIQWQNSIEFGNNLRLITAAAATDKTDKKSFTLEQMKRKPTL